MKTKQGVIALLLLTATLLPVGQSAVPVKGKNLTDSLSGLRTTNSDRYWEEANGYYRNRQYRDALKIYLDLAATLGPSADLYYNLGTAAIRCHEQFGAGTTNGYLALALTCLRRAERLDPGDSDIQANLAYARARRTDRFEASLATVPLALRIARAVATPLVFAFLSALAVLGASLMALVLVRTHRSAPARSRYMRALLICVVAWAVFLAATVLRHNALNTRVEGVISLPVVPVRSEPAGDSGAVLELHEGAEVTILRTDRDWLYVALENGSVGWIPAAALGRI